MELRRWSVITAEIAHLLFYPQCTSAMLNYNRLGICHPTFPNDIIELACICMCEDITWHIISTENTSHTYHRVIAWKHHIMRCCAHECIRKRVVRFISSFSNKIHIWCSICICGSRAHRLRALNLSHPHLWRSFIQGSDMCDLYDPGEEIKTFHVKAVSALILTVSGIRPDSVGRTCVKDAAKKPLDFVVRSVRLTGASIWTLNPYRDRSLRYLTRESSALSISRLLFLLIHAGPIS